MKRLSFRARVLLSLVLFALIPASALLFGSVELVRNALPVLSGRAPWEHAAATGRKAIAAARASKLTADQEAAVADHEQVLTNSLEQASRVSYLFSRTVAIAAGIAAIGIALLALIASRTAGHLSRQLSRPLSEVVEWTELIARGRPLPEGRPLRGAPEFETLRRRMRKMDSALATARERELEAERLEAFRETARRVAHELKNPLTPIRLAVTSLRRATEGDRRMAEIIDVLDAESRRLEVMARSFAQFGTLPEGIAAEVDLAELASAVARSLDSPRVHVLVEHPSELPLVRGYHDALARALTNVVLNAIDACPEGGAVTITVGRRWHEGRAMVELRVRDTGAGISPERIESIWQPYVTNKPGGTGLGLAIVRQTILAHHGFVSASSAVGEGTEITMALPIGGNPAETVEPAVEED
ncbi:MAG: HAMP domain-containing histidine kinase [Gemmatimonadota bacterium]|nr:HAMP domain-containing histidine kinase [Gemmatimonadota bacterium]